MAKKFGEKFHWEKPEGTS